MGLSRKSTGAGVDSGELEIKKQDEDDYVIALAGNPNVGKSTVFNYLTQSHQHTGNWPGKTVTNAQGYCSHEGKGYVLVDIPGCYSLMAHSAEEEVARDFICFDQPDAVVVVCDATCLERNLNLVLQVLEVTGRVVVCVNLMDEAEKKGIEVDLKRLSERLGVPVIGAAARSGRGMNELLTALSGVLTETELSGERGVAPFYMEYGIKLELLIGQLLTAVQNSFPDFPNPRWLATRLLDADESLLTSLKTALGKSPLECQEIVNALFDVRLSMEKDGMTREMLQDGMAEAFVKQAAKVCKGVVSHKKDSYNRRDRRLDRLFTSKATGFPIMFLMLLGIFWLTMVGSNYPSQLLSTMLFWAEDRLLALFSAAHAPEWLSGFLILGVYRVLAWVVSAMLPPMAIFFPLFTLLEDFGYLPRVAFNLDRCFQKCRACGKQALTMMMGFGCNAAGVIGCRIIDSPRERLLAMITNSFVPCNGRFPTLISIISMFLVSGSLGFFATVWSSALLAFFIVLGIGMTLLVSFLLSRTLLKGVPSSFVLELPPYRRPQIGQVIWRSLLDRTIFVLGRAVVVAAPAGMLIYGMANLTFRGETLLSWCAGGLDPLGRLLGMDGVILLGFVLGFPANEIVLPVILMAYMAGGTLTEVSDLLLVKDLLVQNGWTWLTAVCTMLFSLMHWPCSTTCLTIFRESRSIKWTLLAFLLPTASGMAVCFCFAGLMHLLGLG